MKGRTFRAGSRSPKKHHTDGEALWWQHHAIELLLFFSAGTWALVKIEEIIDISKLQSVLARKLQASVRPLKMKNNLTFTESTKEQLQ